MPAELLLSRLRDDPQALQGLVTILLDDLLSRPVDDLVDPTWLAATLVEGFRASATDDRTEAWIRARIDDARVRLDGESSRPRDHVSPDLVIAARDLLRRRYVPDHVIVGRLMDHRAVGSLTREILYTALLDFSTRFRQAAPMKMPSSRRLSRIRGVASEVAGVVSSGVEKQLEGRVRAFVDGAIAASVARMVNHMCSEAQAEEMADWRADSLDVLLDIPVDRYLVELDKLDPDGLVSDLAALLRSLARSEGLASQIEGFLKAAMAEAGGRSARDFLEGSGLEEGWRPHLERLMAERAAALVATDAFAGWLTEALGEKS